jgi:hypothetical protein
MFLFQAVRTQIRSIAILKDFSAALTVACICPFQGTYTHIAEGIRSAVIYNITTTDAIYV